MFTKLTNEQLLNLLIHFQSNHTVILEIIDELTIRKFSNSLDETYIDDILDSYNEYKQLYELFRDERYADKMFWYEAEFYKVTYWAYDVLADKDTKEYKIKKRSRRQTT